MKGSWLLLLVSILGIGWRSSSEAHLLKLEVPGKVMAKRQLLEAILTDSQGNIYHRIVYYDPVKEGIDFDTSLLGPHASLYFPDLEAGYMWYKGHWVNEAGYYWEGIQRVYIDSLNWKQYWTSYWNDYQERYSITEDKRTSSMRAGMHGRGQVGVIYGSLSFSAPTKTTRSTR